MRVLAPAHVPDTPPSFTTAREFQHQQNLRLECQTLKVHEKDDEVCLGTISEAFLLVILRARCC